MNYSNHKIVSNVAMVFVGFLCVAFIVNFFTPLRLTNDTVRYLTIKEAVENQTPVSDYLPYGYVFFLLILGKLHLLYSFTVPLLQFLYLLGALFFVKRLFPDTNRLFLLAFALLQWTTMKYVITFLSEMQFTFFSIGTIYLFKRSRETRNIKFIVGTFLFLGLSILTRTVGVALLPALFVSMLPKFSGSWKENFSRYKWMILLFCVLVVAVSLLQNVLRVRTYLHWFTMGNPLHRLKNDLINHLADWAAIFLNFSYSKVPFGSRPERILAYSIVGLLFFITTVYLIIQSRNRIPLVVKLYLAFYSSIIFLWPYIDPRFWVPIVPLLIAILMQSVEFIPKKAKNLLLLYCVYYLIAGLGAIGFYTYTSMSKHALSVKQDESLWLNEYEQHFFGKPITHPDAKPREKIVRLLEKYD